MIENIQDVFKQVALFDFIYIVLTLLFIIRGAQKGFVLSILSAAKWILAYVVTIYIFPKAKPYVDGIIDSEYVLDIILGVGIFIVIIFLILLFNKCRSPYVRRYVRTNEGTLRLVYLYPVSIRMKAGACRKVTHEFRVTLVLAGASQDCSSSFKPVPWHVHASTKAPVTRRNKPV